LNEERKTLPFLGSKYAKRASAAAYSVPQTSYLDIKGLNGRDGKGRKGKEQNGREGRGKGRRRMKGKVGMVKVVSSVSNF